MKPKGPRLKVKPVLTIFNNLLYYIENCPCGQLHTITDKHETGDVTSTFDCGHTYSVQLFLTEFVKHEPEKTEWKGETNDY